MDLPNDDALRWIVASCAHLRAAHGATIGIPELVLPTGEFFPDEFRHDAASVSRLLRRMIEYAPLAEGLRVELAFLEPEESASGCSTGSCGADCAPKGSQLVEALDHGYRVHVAVTDVRHPVLLTASLVRSVGALVLHEAGEEVTQAAREMAAVVCGFGVLLANGATVCMKSCGGFRIVQATALSVEEMTLALALTLAVYGQKNAAARAHLEATQREAFDMACDWVDSNPVLVEALRDRPEMLESGAFALEPLRGIVGRWLHRRRLRKEMSSQPAATAPAMTAERLRHYEEARKLVDEVLGEADRA
jgi:hypothetical protein